MAPTDSQALRTLLCDELEGRCGFRFEPVAGDNHIKTKLATNLDLLVVVMEAPARNLEGVLRVELKLRGKRVAEYPALKAYVEGFRNANAYRCPPERDKERLVYRPVIREYDQLLAASSEECVAAVAKAIKAMQTDLGKLVPELRQARP